MLDIPPENVAAQGAAAPGPHLPRRHGAGPHRRRRGDQARAGARSSRTASGCSEQPGRHRRPARRRRTCRRPTTRRCCAGSRRSATRTRTCGSCSAPMATNGEEADRLDGHRHAARGAVGPAAAALRLLQAALRAGHQPAARRDPRGARDVDGVDDRARGQPARAAARSRAGRSGSSTRSSTTSSSRSCGTSTTPGSGRSRCRCCSTRARTAPGSSARWSELQRAARATRSTRATRS